VVALVIAVGGHGKAEPDYQAEQRQRSRQEDAVIFSLLRVQIVPLLENISDPSK
jgi:hypothetical protein